MDELKILEWNAKVTTLVIQRNNALDTCVALSAQLALAKARIQDLEEEVRRLRNPS